MDSLQEKPKYKIFANHDDEHISEILYTDNTASNSARSHVRLNNTIAVTIVNQHGNIQLARSAKIIFIFFDRMNNLNVLLTLDCN